MKNIMSFRAYMLQEAASIDNILSKIQAATTEAGLKELETYYLKRKKEVEVAESDDIIVRDAIAGRYEQIEAEKAESMEEEESEPEDV